MIDRESVLFANHRFYLAFDQHDLAAMATLWAQHNPVICIHPGWPALTDRDAIMQSWEQILANVQAPAIRQHHEQVLLYAKLACVVCYEQAGDNQLVAVNAFVEEEGDIRMVQHQTGNCVNAPAAQPRAKVSVQ